MASRNKKEKIEETGGELNSIPNEKYKKFFDKFKEIESLDIKQWKVAHILGFFVSKYKEAFNTDYQFKFNDQNPNKSYEVWRVNTLCAKLSSNPEILKNYIEWVFQEKVKKLKRRFTSISFITNEDLVNYYKINILLGNKKNLHLDRSSLLPSEFVNIMATENIQVKTYGDLAFLYQSIKAGGLDSDLSIKFEKAFNQMKNANFDETVLERIV